MIIDIHYIQIYPLVIKLINTYIVQATIKMRKRRTRPDKKNGNAIMDIKSDLCVVTLIPPVESRSGIGGEVNLLGKK